MSRDLPLFPLHAFMAWTETALPFIMHKQQSLLAGTPCFVVSEIRHEIRKDTA